MVKTMLWFGPSEGTLQVTMPPPVNWALLFVQPLPPLALMNTTPVGSVSVSKVAGDEAPAKLELVIVMEYVNWSPLATTPAEALLKIWRSTRPVCGVSVTMPVALGIGVLLGATVALGVMAVGGVAIAVSAAAVCVADNCSSGASPGADVAVPIVKTIPTAIRKRTPVRRIHIGRNPLLARASLMGPEHRWFSPAPGPRCSTALRSAHSPPADCAAS